ncbi:MAG TPA: hypothetical protein VK519_09505 [Pinirhizobacter sp.]|uniref:hypothetical protein n=1 Tax=Pinirhizobacter sp. TaxID=2950432 RepID=UPI002B75B105|nr:hypothetical protein [Pinirhizobacter sp.]HMH68144.1 hypothetical protein [Pinirhizobacter sp.]
MKNTRSWRACALATVTALAVGCSHPPPPDPNAPPTPQAAQSTARPYNPLDPLLKTRDRARAVQTTVDQQHATQDAAVEDQSK